VGAGRLGSAVRLNVLNEWTERLLFNVGQRRRHRARTDRSYPNCLDVVRVEETSLRRVLILRYGKQRAPERKDKKALPGSLQLSQVIARRLRRQPGQSNLRQWGRYP